MTGRSGRYLVAAASIVVLSAVAAGLFTLGSPGAARQRRADRTRVGHLQQISKAVNLHWTRHHAVPATVAEIVRDGQALPERDPSTGEPYEYRAIDVRMYQLCARFQAVSGSPTIGDFWHHEAGRQCFQLEVEQVQP